MAALKKAYAHVILNMAKESASRIMAAESKAVRFQQNLKDVKDEGLSTLLRLKGIMDAKVIMFCTFFLTKLWLLDQNWRDFSYYYSYILAVVGTFFVIERP